MLQFVLHLLLTSFGIFGIHAASQRGHILRRYIWSPLVASYVLRSSNRPLALWYAEWWLKPVYRCPTCMASAWGSASYLIFGSNLLLLPVFVVCLSGLNHIISKLTK